ncbi:MAG: hypothetical protein ABH879_09110 [archaeon]
METKDWISFLIGLVLTASGVLPLLNSFNIGPPIFALSFMPVQIFAYIAAGAGFYLMINSVIEISNSNAVGWISFLIALLILAAGALQVLNRFGIGMDWFALSWLSHTIYYVLFILEGTFLMIACFAMEL